MVKTRIEHLLAFMQIGRVVLAKDGVEPIRNTEARKRRVHVLDHLVLTRIGVNLHPGIVVLRGYGGKRCFGSRFEGLLRGIVPKDGRLERHNVRIRKIVIDAPTDESLTHREKWHGRSNAHQGDAYTDQQTGKVSPN